MTWAGYSNRETWLVITHLDNNSKELLDYAKRCANATPPSVASIKLSVENTLAFDPSNPLTYDLARQALAYVNWEDVVTHLQED
jgi:hypothetical protein